MEACFTSHKKSENSYSLGVGVEDVYLLFLKPFFGGGEDEIVVNYKIICWFHIIDTCLCCC